MKIPRKFVVCKGGSIEISEFFQVVDIQIPHHHRSPISFYVDWRRYIPLQNRPEMWNNHGFLSHEMSIYEFRFVITSRDPQ
jgi:ABC-type sulfate transport system substrate-binding protein